ncbi:unnamed protein product [Ostreobium quekettii]|uniref:Uncharacterized protein n=1 Tax=Ostreobium quekettii TaxID=121088 RepID=A0A8S1IU68_9CHLO|nr:unnamed protein product [Ostreobium quekettii]|eukprot:evm.model.scf_419EXC.9 EVM.evm.TU.scf_419EXC.9   scf_419EXC:74326-77750(-)
MSCPCRGHLPRTSESPSILCQYRRPAASQRRTAHLANLQGCRHAAVTRSPTPWVPCRSPAMGEDSRHASDRVGHAASAPQRLDWLRFRRDTQPCGAHQSSGGSVQVPAPAVLCSSQFDALRLDEELAMMLREKLRLALAPFGPLSSSWRSLDLEGLLGLFVDCLVFCLTTGSNRPTPGQALLNLRFASASGQPCSEHRVGRNPY